jgi:hypothetical protein
MLSSNARRILLVGGLAAAILSLLASDSEARWRLRRQRVVVSASEDTLRTPPIYRAHRRPANNPGAGEPTEPSDWLRVDQYSSPYPTDVQVNGQVCNYPLVTPPKRPLAEIETHLTGPELWPNPPGIPNNSAWYVVRNGSGSANYSFFIQHTQPPTGAVKCGPYANLQQIIDKHVLTVMAASPTPTCP